MCAILVTDLLNVNIFYFIICFWCEGAVMLNIESVKWNLLGLLLIVVFSLCIIEIVYVDVLVSTTTAKCSFNQNRLTSFS